MHTLYLDISSDKVYLSCNGEELFLERNGIEDVLGKILIQRRRKYNFTKAYILNGPGGFTNLRVGSLCVNLLNALMEDQIDLYSVSKIDLYSFAYGKGLVERYGIIYIGQKKNIWLWDFEKKEKVGQMNFDQLKQIMNDGKITKPFLDTVYDLDYYPDFLKHGAAVYLNYSIWKQLLREYVEEGKVQPTKDIEANYMIDPIIGRITEDGSKLQKISPLDPITYDIIGISMKIHKELGGNLREEVYKKALKAQLIKKGYSVKDEEKVDLQYLNDSIGHGRVDLLVNEEIVVELKSKGFIKQEDFKQLRTYLQFGNKQIGLLIDFGGKSLIYKRLEKDYKKP